MSFFHEYLAVIVNIAIERIKDTRKMQTPELFLKRKIKKCCLINFLIS